MIDLYGWIMTYEEEVSHPPYRVTTLKLRRNNNRLVWESLNHFCSPLPNIWALECAGWDYSYSGTLFAKVKTFIKLSNEVFYIDTSKTSYVQIPYEELPLVNPI